MHPKQIESLFNSFNTKHNDMWYRWNHYKGNQSFLKKSTNNDGSEKSNVATNFLDYIIDSHVAGSTSIPFTYTKEGTEDDAIALANLAELYSYNEIETTDSEHFLNALVMGYSVEVISVKNGRCEFTAYKPTDWAFIYDENQNIKLAIHCGIHPANSFVNGHLTTDKTITYTVYDSTMIYQFSKQEKEKEFHLVSETIHFFDEVPIVLFTVNQDASPFLNSNIINQNNLYSKLVNNRVDDIEYNVDSLLKITGFDMDANNPEHMNRLRIMKQARIFVIPDSNADIDFINKGNENTKYDSAIKTARENLFTQGKVPDRQDVQGALGNLSGIAIKHMYQPTIQQSAFFMKYFKRALHRRITLNNMIWKIQQKPLLEKYQINHNFYLPVDIESVTRAAMNLQGIVSNTKILEMLPDVDPAKEIQRMKDESIPVESTPTVQPIEMDPEKRTAKRESAITSKIPKTADRLEKEYLSTLKTDIAARISNAPEFKQLFEQV